MWPFKKKAQPQVINNKAANTVICIPGNWESWDEFILEIVAASKGEYIAAGWVLMNIGKELHYKVDFCEHDERMKEAFKCAGKVTNIGDGILDEIDKHKAVVYISGETGSVESAKHIALAAATVLTASGIGIKVETAGKAFAKADWLKLTETATPFDIYQMFVADTITMADGTVFSCGMHNLGYKDTIIKGEPFQEAAALISLFNFYQIIHKPVIHSGQTFQAEVGASIFYILNEPNQPYKESELFENHFGMWRLARKQE